MESLDRFSKKKFSWFEGTIAQRCVQFIFYVLAAGIVSLIFSPFFN